jgi:general secretion pathway protein J
MKRLNAVMLGFTLVEVLVGMTLLSVMLVLLFGSLKMSSESWERGENKIKKVNEAAAVYNFFQRYLQTAMPLCDLTNKEEQTFSFQGKKDSLQFVSVRPASFIGPREQIYNVGLEKMAREQVIKVSMSPFFPSAEGEEWQTDEEILLRHVNHLSFEYFGSDEGEDNPRWQDDWLTRTQLPKLIKIKFDGEAQEFWPELIVELKASATASFNAGSQGTGDADQQNYDSENQGDSE